MDVYVIEKGCYSDRHVVGVTETQEEAERICELLNRIKYDAYANWEKYDTHQFITKPMRFLVSNDFDEWRVDFDDYDLYKNYTENSEIYEGYYVIYAREPDVAIKIAQDLDARIKAEKLQIV